MIIIILILEEDFGELQTAFKSVIKITERNVAFYILDNVFGKT